MRLNRRQFLSGHAASPQCHIASLVVQCLPEKLDKTCTAIEGLQSAEIPVRDESGKFVVLLEMDSESELLEKISEVQSIPGVISANLAYHQVDQ
ncbi:MAG: chaperone NapD [Halioglobus sp.]